MDGGHFRAQLVDFLFSTIVLGFCAGIIFASVAVVSARAFICIGAVVVLLLAGAAFASGKRGASFLFASIFLCSAVFGIVRMESAVPDASTFANSVGKKITVAGVIDQPEYRASGTQFTLSPDASDAQILVSAENAPKLSYGDEVSVTGKLQTPENFMTDQGTEFDYVSYLYKDDILYRMSYAKVAMLAHGHGSWIIAHLGPLESWFEKGFNRVLPVREADLLGGLVLGTKENISSQFRDDLVATGTIHIIALSGYNVTVVATFLRALLAEIPFLGTGGASVGGVIGIIVFVLMTGAQSSAIRAGIMAIVAVFARSRGRTYDAARALIFAGFVMVVWNPKYLVFDVSFQLSFLATLGIIFLTPIFAQKLRRVPEKVLWIIPMRELMATTLGAQIAVLPFILYEMGTLSLIALPANMLVLPAVPFAMGIGTLAGVFGNFSATLAAPFTFAAHVLLEYIIHLVEFFAKVPYAMLVVHDFPLAICIILYIALGIFVWRFYEKREETK